MTFLRKLLVTYPKIHLRILNTFFSNREVGLRVVLSSCMSILHQNVYIKHSYIRSNTHNKCIYISVLMQCLSLYVSKTKLSHTFTRINIYQLAQSPSEWIVNCFGGSINRNSIYSRLFTDTLRSNQYKPK